MENLRDFYVKEISNSELIEIDGGGWLYDLGASAHRTWCAVKEMFATDHEMGMPFTA